MSARCPSIVALAVALGFGCVPAERYEEERLRAICSFYVECGDYPDVDLCLEIEFPAGGDGYLESAVAAGRIRYDAGEGRGCIKAIEDLRCTYREDADALVASACKDVFEGTVPPEGECLDTRDCAGDSVCGFDPTCVAADACCPGHCRFLGDRAEIGEDCGSRGCVDGAVCAFDGDDFTCVATPRIGESCELTGECGVLAYCSDDDVCVGLKGEGGACQYNGQCTPPGYCDFDPEAQLGHCRHPAADGEACDITLDERACLSVDHFCDPIGSHCERRRGPGESCLGSDQCIGYTRCNNGSCVEFRGPGETCSFDTQTRCYPGLFCDGERCQQDEFDDEVCVLE